MTAVDTDIDSFIQQQKAKLANERNILNNGLLSVGELANFCGRGIYFDAKPFEAEVYYNPVLRRSSKPHEVDDISSRNAPARRKWADNQSAQPQNFAQQGTPIEIGLPLTNRGYHDSQRDLALQRRQEYNELLEKKGLGKAKDAPRPGHSDPRQSGLDIGHYEDERKILDRERQRDYQHYQEQQRAKASSRAQAPEIKQDSDYNSGVLDYNSGKFSYQQSRKQLAEERRKEYNDLLRSKREKSKERQEVEIDAPTIIPFDRADQDKARLKALEEERRREYNQVKAKLQERKPQREPTPQDDYGLPVGEYQKQKQKGRDQREYREMLQRQQEEQKRLVLIQEMGVAPEKVPYILEQEKRNLGHYPESNYNSAQAQEKRVQFESPNLEERYSYQRHLQSPPPPQQQQQPPSPLLNQQYHQSPFPTRGQSTAATQPPWHRNSPPPQREQSDKMNSAEYRQRWRDQHRLGSVKRPKWGPPAPVEPLNLLGSGIPEQDMAEYRRRWFELKGKHLEPGSTRKQWSSPVKLSPRGTLDTDRLILEVQREKEMNEYRESWRRQRGELQEPSPRRPQRGPSDSRPPPPPPVQRPTDQDDYRRKWQQHHAQGQEPAPYINRNLDTKGKNMMAALDTESIIQQVVKEKREKEEREARQNNNVLVGGGGGGGPASNRGANPPRVSGSPAPAMDKDTYKRLWAQQNSQRRGPFEPTSSTRNKKDSNVPRLDTDALIAEVMAEKLEEENQKLRQERQQLEAAKRAMAEPRKPTPAQRSQRQIEPRLADAQWEVDDYRMRWKAQNSEVELVPASFMETMSLLNNVVSSNSFGFCNS
ncbi:hypothetical protein RRG08_009962 [Elysia crispata]|uniref:Uncharacterized protein n=1 Tax=Elysia crispata TaxID=231223 RepID=A0AAE1B4C0_9GAST|nr:hypothetical protein RRG08_009962 [Elysia crispata]